MFVQRHTGPPGAPDPAPLRGQSRCQGPGEAACHWPLLLVGWELRAADRLFPGLVCSQVASVLLLSAVLADISGPGTVGTPAFRMACRSPRTILLLIHYPLSLSSSHGDSEVLVVRLV